MSLLGTRVSGGGLGGTYWGDFGRSRRASRLDFALVDGSAYGLTWRVSTLSVVRGRFNGRAIGRSSCASTLAADVAEYQL